MHNIYISFRACNKFFEWSRPKRLKNALLLFFLLLFSFRIIFYTSQHTVNRHKNDSLKSEAV